MIEISYTGKKECHFLNFGILGDRFLHDYIYIYM